MGQRLQDLDTISAMARSLAGLSAFEVQFYNERLKAYQGAISIGHMSAAQFDAAAVLSDSIRRRNVDSDRLISITIVDL